MNSDKVIQKINQTIEQKLIALDLSNCGLQVLPEELLKFLSLEELDLSGNYLKNISGIEQLQKLKKLNLNSNERLTDEALRLVNKLENIVELRLANCYGIENLNIIDFRKNMERIDLSENEITNLDFFTFFKNLKYINISNNNLQFIEDFMPFLENKFRLVVDNKNHEELKYINIKGTPIANIYSRYLTEKPDDIYDYFSQIVEDDTLKPLPYLYYYIIDSDTLEKYDEECYANVGNLRLIDLSDFESTIILNIQSLFKEEKNVFTEEQDFENFCDMLDKENLSISIRWIKFFEKLKNVNTPYISIDKIFLKNKTIFQNNKLEFECCLEYLNKLGLIFWNCSFKNVYIDVNWFLKGLSKFDELESVVVEKVFLEKNDLKELFKWKEKEEMQESLRILKRSVQNISIEEDQKINTLADIKNILSKFRYGEINDSESYIEKLRYFIYQHDKSTNQFIADNYNSEENKLNELLSEIIDGVVSYTYDDCIDDMLCFLEEKKHLFLDKEKIFIPGLFPNLQDDWDIGFNSTLIYTYEKMPYGIINELGVTLKNSIAIEKNRIGKNGVIFQESSTQIRIIEHESPKQLVIDIRADPNAEIKENPKSFKEYVLRNLNSKLIEYNLKYQVLGLCYCKHCQKIKDNNCNKRTIFYKNDLQYWLTKGIENVYCNWDNSDKGIKKILGNDFITQNNELRKMKTNLWDDKKKKRVFISYSRSDKKYASELKEELKIFEDNGKIATFYDKDIQLGELWEQEIKEKLKQADIVLFLLSRKFIQSNFIKEEEIKLAIDKYYANKKLVKIFSIMLSPCQREETVFAKLQGLPREGNLQDLINENEEKAWKDLIDELKIHF